ncbi:transposase IS4 family protein [Streptomyces glaucescens]|uniref:Transposase IS4 family protein n=1 Tax=Streptomyces glaucescens TaxID=1907 RepID=A0A089YSX2_STRGA|nr:transposase IS4 family protein [Streptomyces glaucescens]
MDAGGAAASAATDGAEGRATREAPATTDRGRDLLRGADRLRLAAVAARLPTLADRVLVLRTLARRGHRRPRHDALRAQVRRAEGRSAEPSAGLIDSQSVRTADTVPAATRGFDAGKKVKGRKQFLVTDTLGLLLAVHVITASTQDRDGARRPLLWARLDYPSVRKVWADQGFAGRLVDWTTHILGRELEIVRKDPGQRGFQVQPKRWAIERTFSWLTAHRRLARDYETSPTHAETMIRWAMIGVMVRRLARGCPATRPGLRPLRRTAGE